MWTMLKWTRVRTGGGQNVFETSRNKDRRVLLSVKVVDDGCVLEVTPVKNAWRI